MQAFANKVVVITGGSSGIGRSIAEQFNAQGAKVAILGRDAQKLHQTTAALAYQGDVCKIADLDRFYQEVQKQLGNVDVLVANAGIAALHPVQQVNEHFFDEMVNTNYKGLYFSIQRALPFLNQGASIILISSAAAHMGWPSHSVYSSTKAAVSQLARNFSADLIDQGIRVNAISPGFVNTPMFNDTPSQTIQTLSNIIPIKRFASAEEIGHVALFLASPSSSYIVGADLVVDGGLSAIFPAKA